MKVKESEEEKLYFSDYNPDDLETYFQHKVNLYYNKRSKHKRHYIYSILVIVDDFADDPSFSRHSKLLHSLFTRGRHNSISTVVSTQKFTAIAPIIRVNATFIIVYRLRNSKDLETFLEELSAMLTRKELVELYQLTTKEPYSFLYINLVAKTLNNMFYINVKQKVTFE